MYISWVLMTRNTKLSTPNNQVIAPQSTCKSIKHQVSILPHWFIPSLLPLHLVGTSNSDRFCGYHPSPIHARHWIASVFNHQDSTTWYTRQSQQLCLVAISWPTTPCTSRNSPLSLILGWIRTGCNELRPRTLYIQVYCDPSIGWQSHFHNMCNHEVHADATRMK